MNGSWDLASLREIRNPSSQNVVLMTTVLEPGTARSRACPDGKGGRLSLTRAPRGPGRSAVTAVESSGLVVSTRTFRPSTPTVPVISARVVIIEVAIPFSVATLTRLTSLPDVPPSDSSIVCVAGPTSLKGAGIESVMPKIWSAWSGKACSKAQKKGDDRVTSVGAQSSSLLGLSGKDGNGNYVRREDSISFGKGLFDVDRDFQKRSPMGSFPSRHD